MDKHQPVIEFQNYRITNIDFSVYQNMDEINELDIEEGRISATLSIDDTFENSRLRISTTIIDKENLRTITAEITGYFKINVEDEKKAEEYSRINGTAILAPFLRTTISILTSLDNENAVILPTLNTNNFTEKTIEK